MSDDRTPPASEPPSGSRWEQPTPQPPPVPAYAPARPHRGRGRLLLAGGAVGIALVAGTGGFALGHATADDGRDDRGRFGGPGNLQNFPGGGPMRGPQGTFPGQGRPGQPPDGFPGGRRHAGLPD